MKALNLTLRRFVTSVLVTGLVALPVPEIFFAPPAHAIDIVGESVIGNGNLEPDENLDFQIISKVPGETTAELVFSDTDPDGENDFTATHVNCRQYLKILFRSNRVVIRAIHFKKAGLILGPDLILTYFFENG